MAAALITPLTLGTSGYLTETKKYNYSKTPLTPKQIRNRNATKRQRSARKITRPTY